jgi:hypothetical protein
MTEESIATLLNHPLAAVVVAAIVAGVTAALTVKLLMRQPEAAAAGPGGGMRTAVPAAEPDNRAVIAAIAAAVAATGAHRVLYIGEPQTGSGWAASLRSRHHESHMPKKRTATDQRAAMRGDDTP